jgi:hypothetical protein
MLFVGLIVVTMGSTARSMLNTQGAALLQGGRET